MKENEKEIFISFVIPVRDGEKTIRETLSSIFLQDTSVLYEVIVVNNASRDNTVQLIRDFKIILLHENRIGRSYARNKGLFHAKGEWVCFIDADVVLHEDWLKGHLFLLKQDFYDVFTGRILPKSKKENTFSKFREEYLSVGSWGSFNLTDRNNFEVPMINTAACTIRKSYLISINGFDNSLVTYEDYDLSKRLWYEGASFCVLTGIHADVYWTKGEFWSYLVRSFYMGKGLSQLNNKWNISSVLSIPRIRKINYSSFLFKIYDFLLVLASFIAYEFFKDTGCRESNSILEVNKRRLKKFFLNGKFFVTTPSVRIIQTSSSLIFKDVASSKTIHLPLISSTVLEDIQKNEKIITSEKMGFFFNVYK